LYGSQLQNLPESIVNLTKLTGLWVHNNNLQTLPENTVNLSQLNQFRLSGNPDLILTTQQCDFVTTISSYTLDDDICE